eukprot:IDg19985t1
MFDASFVAQWIIQSLRAEAQCHLALGDLVPDVARLIVEAPACNFGRVAPAAIVNPALLCSPRCSPRLL